MLETIDGIVDLVRRQPLFAFGLAAVAVLVSGATWAALERQGARTRVGARKKRDEDGPRARKD